MRAAILSGNVVSRVLILDQLDEYPGAIDGSNADIGDTWTGSAFVKPARSLNRAKSDARTELLARWAAAERVGVTFGGKVYSTDTDNLARISIYAARARRAKEDGVAFVVAVLAADDSAPNLNRQELLDLEQAIGDRFKLCADNAKSLRQAIAAATTVAEVQAINLAAGWPA